MTVATIAQGARSQLLIKTQSVLGTAATGNYTKLRFSTHSLDVTKTGVESDEIRSDRQIADYRHGNRQAAGEIAMPLIFGDVDTLIESAMFSTFDTDSIDIGVAPQYLSIEDGALDIAQYRLFQDMLVDTMGISIQSGESNAICRATFGLMGRDGAAPAGSTSGGTPVAATANQPFDSFNGALYENAEESGDEVAIVTGLEINVANGVNPAFAIGQQTAVAMEYGRGRVTGTLTAYYEDGALIGKFLNETESVIVMNITDPDGNVMEFRMPRVKYTGGSVPVANEQSRIITMPFVALLDATTGTALRISKA